MKVFFTSAGFENGKIKDFFLRTLAKKPEETKALFIPTPGQTEQEYLGSLFYDRGIALSVGQEELNLKHHIPAALLYRGFEPTANDHLLENRLDLLFS